MRAPIPHLSVLALLGNAACSSQGTDLTQLVNASAFADAGIDASLGSSARITDPFAGAAAFVATTGPSAHNPGTSCFNTAACHALSGGKTGAPDLLIGGTIYTDYKGTTPAPGVEVRAVDGQGKVVSAFTGPEGNFYLLSAASNGLSFPLVVGARSAQTTRPMITTVVSSYGSCGQNTCHVPGGGTPATGNYYPIHVP